MSAPGGHRYRRTILAVGVLSMSWNGLALTATAEISAGVGIGCGVLVAATSYRLAARERRLARTLPRPRAKGAYAHE